MKTKKLLKIVSLSNTAETKGGCSPISDGWWLSIWLHSPGVPAVAVINVQADTQTALILLHILAPAIPGGKGHLAPVKIISENNNLK